MECSYIFLATGFEEIEALATVDVLRRGGMDVKLVSIHDEPIVAGAHGIVVTADTIMADTDFTNAEWLICPGGLPGSENLYNHDPLAELLQAHNAAGKQIAAICAAPALVLARLGILAGKRATCYPGFGSVLAECGANPLQQHVVIDGNTTTGNGPASAAPFALAIVEQSKGADVAKAVADGMLC